jgi:uncharacterized membrane protein YedE/YeeE
MGGAILVGVVAFAIVGKRSLSLLGDPIRLPAKRELDKRLVFGSLGFGVGWDLPDFARARPWWHWAPGK